MTEERPPAHPLEARKALQDLTLAVGEMEKIVADLTVRDRELTTKSETLTQRIARDATRLQEAERCCGELTEKLKELEPRARDLDRRLKEEERRANTAELQASILADKAADYDKLAAATSRLITMLDLLPTEIEEADLIPSAVKPSVELFGTYAWRNVLNARFAMQTALDKEREPECPSVSSTGTTSGD